MKHIFIYIICCFFFSKNLTGQNLQKITISGYVKEAQSNESVIGANVHIKESSLGTTTNTYGFYSITLPKSDSITIIFSHVAYPVLSKKIYLEKSIELNVELNSSILLGDITIIGDIPAKYSDRTQMSLIDLPVSQVQDIPSLFGEKDIMKVLQLKPGVQSGSEGNSGLYVRGGSPDQNLIILDDAIVYNASHLFGFFSLFNNDALKSVQLLKGGFPARYGGRLSSVIDINLKDGNSTAFHGTGGIGLLASRLTLEGPLVKGKSSFIISGRRTYFDVLSKPFQPKENKVGYAFYDLNAKINYDFGNKDKIYLSGYFGRDHFNQREIRSEIEKTSNGLQWGNATGTLRWNHLFNNKLFSNTSLIFSDYTFDLYADEIRESENIEARYSSGIRDYTLKYDIDFFPNPSHSIKLGVHATLHQFTPNAYVIKDTQQEISFREVLTINNTESAIYLEDDFKINSRLRINGGMRVSYFYFEEGKINIKPEPRVSLSYHLKQDMALKASFANMNQYVHLLSNTGLGIPTDLWVPSTDKIAPQNSQQLALGLVKDFSQHDLALTIETYYKKSAQVIAYKEGASFFSINENPLESQKQVWENKITSGQGWSYGVEFLLEKQIGKLSGWVGYTLSWSLLQFDSLNNGKKFYARYDRRHDISLVSIYKLKKNLIISGSWVLGTGNALTLPISQYDVAHHRFNSNIDPNFDFDRLYINYMTEYGERNSFRMASYHRLDLVVQFIKEKKWGERSWEISVYNAYNRKNPFFYYAERDITTQRTKLKQHTLFPLIPSIAYNFKF